MDRIYHAHPYWVLQLSLWLLHPSLLLILRRVNQHQSPRLNQRCDQLGIQAHLQQNIPLLIRHEVLQAILHQVFLRLALHRVYLLELPQDVQQKSQLICQPLSQRQLHHYTPPLNPHLNQRYSQPLASGLHRLLHKLQRFQ